MARTRDFAGHRRSKATTIDRSPEAVADLVLRSFVHALQTERCTLSSAARWMGLSRSTVERWRAGKVPPDADAVLRSSRLALPFARHLCRLVAVRNGRVA